MSDKDVSELIIRNLLKACKSYFKENLPDSTFPVEFEISLQGARDKTHGDLASNIAMRLASVAKCPPPVLAEGIAEQFRNIIKNDNISSIVSNVEVNKAFINFHFSDEYYHQILLDLYEQKDRFGSSEVGAKEHVNIEFVSANPTGPLTLAHGRQAAIGDALSRILKFNGYKVTNEYYLNDYGRQINLLGKSVEARYRVSFGEAVDMPEDGYMGEYINVIAEDIKKEKGDALLKSSPESEIFFREYAVKYILDLIKHDLDDFGVFFDTWTSQRSIEEKNEVEKVLKQLEKKGYIYEDGGAKWFASTRFDDDKDRVVVKSDGSYTYLAPDIAYHMDKYRRKFTRLIDLLGPDHHGYIKRMKAAVQALGHDAGSLDIMVIQLVTLIRDGKTLSMSTRKGEFLSLREIIDEIGKDVTRFFFLSRRLDSHLDFDLDLAKKESADNPVFYIQYAHARICSIKEFSVNKKIKPDPKKVQMDLLDAKEEKILIRKLSEFPHAVRTSAEVLEPNRIIVYLNELSRSFHSFYTECRVVTEEPALTNARLFLVECVRIVLANGLGLLNITLPEKM